MARLAHALAPALLLVSLVSPVLAQRADFSSQVRVLLTVQDALAKGHDAATVLQRSLVTAIEADFGGSVEPEATTRNARAAISYVLSGGPPTVAERLAAAAATSEIDRRLLAGVLRFKRRDSAGAWQQLAAIDATPLAPEVAGRVALAQSMLASDAEPERRLELLRLAANLMPGTLVEESALRRLIRAAAAEGRLEVFWPAADRYFRRFHQSVFMPDFADFFVGDLIGLVGRKVEVDPARLDLVLTRLPRGLRSRIYLQLAHKSWRAGRWSLTQFGAARARRLAADHSPEWQRAELYAAAGALTGPDGSEQGARLAALDAATLDADDRMLLVAALKVAGLIAAAESPVPLRDDGGAGDGAAGPAVVARARRSLTAAQAALEEPGESRP